jgi:transcriptional regulator with XRE-family HTH domain
MGDGRDECLCQTAQCEEGCDVVTASGTTVFKRYVALELGRLRDASGLSRDAVAEHLGCSVGHVRHLETAYSTPKPLEVRHLLPLYGAGERTEDFLKLVDAARRGRDWWADFPGVPERLDLLLGMEAAAVAIHSYDAMLVPGLFQTPAYAEAVIRAGKPNLPEAELQPLIDLRMQRQDILTRRPDPPAVWRVLDESVLHRRTENPKVMIEQLKHLVKLAKLPNVHIQILPFDAVGVHAGMDGSFTVFTFGPEMVGDPGVAYTESRVSGNYYEKPADIQCYRDTWSLVQLQALNPEESLATLVRRAEEITT